MQLGILNKVQCRFACIVSKADTGDVVNKTDWFNNIVLDQGLERLGIGGVASHCRVGSGSSDPDKTQTDLDSQVAYTTDVQSSDAGVNTSQGYSWIRKTFRFSTGAAAGNLTEVGVGWGSSGNNLFNRAMIRDTGGQKTTVTVLADEVLDVLVELRSYVNLSPTSSSAYVSTVEYQASVRPYISRHDSAFGSAYTCVSANGYSGPMTSNTALPTGDLGAFGVTNQGYEPASLKKSFDLYWGLNTGNSAPLKTIVIATNYCTYQVQLQPTIPKTSETVLRLSFDVSWGRYE